MDFFLHAATKLNLVYIHVPVTMHHNYVNNTSSTCRQNSIKKSFFRLSKILFAGPKSWNHIGFDFYN